MKPLIVSTRDSVVTLQLTGTGVFNEETLAAMNTALDEMLRSDEANLLLLTGDGKNFSQGFDLEFLGSLPDADSRMDFIKRSMMMIGRLLGFPLPVSAAVNGHAFGLGAMLVLASDYVAMRADRGFFCLPEVDLNMTLTPRLNALVIHKMSPRAIRDTLLTGGRLNGAQARGHGIVDAVCDTAVLRNTAIELAGPMRGKHRATVAGLKRGANLPILEVIESDVPETTF